MRLVKLGGLIYLGLLVADHYGYGNQYERYWAIILLSTLAASIVYSILMSIFKKFMLLAFRYEALGPFDALFLLDDPKNLSNILACCYLEPFEFNQMMQVLLKRLDKLHKCKSKLVKFLGLWWFKEMDDVEWLAKQEYAIVQKTGIHTEEDLIKFMTDEYNIRHPYDNVQYSLILIPDFEPGKRGAIILKAHHCFADGLGLSTFMLYVFGEFSASDIPGLKPLPWWKRLVIIVAAPMLLTVASFKILFTCRNHNSIKRNKPMTGRKRGAYTGNLQPLKMKAYCKQRGITINDYCTAVLSNTLFEYFNTHQIVEGEAY